MTKKLVALLIIFVLGFVFYKATSRNPSILSVTDDKAELILFWGEGCPHCEVVKDYIKDNQLDTQINLSLKEVYYDKANQRLLEDTVKKCPEIDVSRGIGVPLAFVPETQTCYLGDQPIIEQLDKMLK